MKALTLFQPWASLVALGEKKVETRSWGTSYRGPLAIHAAKRLPLNWSQFKTEHFVDALENVCGLNEFGAPNLDRLPTGVVLCMVNLVDVVGMAIEVPPHYYGLPGYALSGRDYAFGNFGPGRFGWVFDFDEEPVLLDPPLPWSGRQRLWELPASAVPW